MAIFQSMFSFFLPSRRRRRAAGGGGRPLDPATEQLVAGLEETFSEANIPEQISDNVLDDFKKAFTVKGVRPGYEPGAVPPISFNLIDAATDPVGTAWKTASAVFQTEWSDFVSTPAVIWRESEENAWDRLNKSRGFLNERGESVMPSSLRQALERWNEGVSSESLRQLRDIRKNPGFSLMIASRLGQHYGADGPTIGGLTLGDIASRAGARESEITQLLALAESAENRGDFGAMTDLYRQAGKVQSDWEKESGDFRKQLERNFRWHADGGDLSNTPEARFYRYWKGRNLHHTTLNFLKTLRKDGVGGVFKEYLWRQVVHGHIFRTGTWREYLYPPNIVAAVVKGTVGKLLKPLTTALVNARARFVYLRKKYITKAIKTALASIGERLGLTALFASLGSIIGTPIGGVISGAIAFLGDVLIDKLGGAFKVAGYGLLFGVSCVVALAASAMLFAAMAVIIIFNPDAGAPTAGGQCTDYTMGAIDAAISAASSKYKVPPSLLRAVFEIEGLDYIASPSRYTCKENAAAAAGLMQITKNTYKLVTCEDERLDDDIAQCEGNGDKLSRCDVNDAFELAARVLLSKVGKWDYSTCTVSDSISASSLADVYNASCRYYGSFNPDNLTRQYGYNLRGAKRPDPPGMNYCDIVCNKMGLCPAYPSQSAQ